MTKCIWVLCVLCVPYLNTNLLSCIVGFHERTTSLDLAISGVGQELILVRDEEIYLSKITCNYIDDPDTLMYFGGMPDSTISDGSDDLFIIEGALYRQPMLPFS